jgi:hypothetical protein
MCGTVLAEGRPCGFPLLEVSPVLVVIGDATPKPPEPDPARTSPIEPEFLCPNGHPVAPDDTICGECGETIRLPEPPIDAPEETPTIGRWRLVGRTEATVEYELFAARADDNGEAAVFKFYQLGIEPDVAIYAAARRLSSVHAARLLEEGRHDGRAYEAWEQIEGPALSDLMLELKRDRNLLRAAAVELIGALADFERVGLRHGGLKPGVVRVRSRNPLHLVLTDFAAATLGEFEVEIARARQATRYVAPETIADTSSAASDWWSLGIILLELLTDGACFEGVHDRAFLLHLVTRGIRLPDGLDPEWRPLLEGLLTRDHAKRWRAAQAQRWAAGERDIPTFYESGPEAVSAGLPLIAGGQRFTRPADFALAAADQPLWDEALGLFESGRLATWLREIDPDDPRLAHVRRLQDDRSLDLDQALALALAALNEDLPLCVRGEIVTPNSILADPARGGLWLDAAPMRHLRLLRRDTDAWLVRLADRSDRVRSRARDLRLSLVEDRFQIMRLSPFAAALEAQWRSTRALFPDAAHPAIAALIERRLLSDEDLLLLLCTEQQAFKSTEQVLGESVKAAQEAGLAKFDPESARAPMALARRDLFERLNERIGAFKRTGRPRINEWADSFRLQRRVSLPRALVMLAVPADEWQEPPHQEYLGNVLDFLEKKILVGVQRGPLVQLRASRSSARIDPAEFGERDGPAFVDAIVCRRALDHLVGGGRLDPAVVERMRRLDSQARTYRRDTGINALVLGFPILLSRETKADNGSRTRIAPVLLWPVKNSLDRGQAGGVRIAFDAEREVQLNPALESIVGARIFDQWRSAADDLLRSTIGTYGDVLDALRGLAPVAQPGLEPLPSAAAADKDGEAKLYAAGAVFIADYASQAIARDLEALKGKRPEGTAFETLLRLRDAPAATDVTRGLEATRFAVLEADPSQEGAVLRARENPGLLLQGPPGTGKSQTIVNVITDCIGRGETVLVVCEKQAALEVVHKRLTAENLGHRVFRVESTQTDRRRLLGELQNQVPRVLRQTTDDGALAVTRRRALAARIDRLEADLDAHYRALYAPSPRLGLSYRDVLSVLAAEGIKSAGLGAPNLLETLGRLGPEELAAVTTECKGLAEVWLDGRVEDSPLAIFRMFNTDAVLARQLSGAVATWSAADTTRACALEAGAAMRDGPVAVSDASRTRDWLDAHAAALAKVPAYMLTHARIWRAFFSTDGALRARCETQRKALAALIDRLARLAGESHAQLFRDNAARLDDGALGKAKRMGKLFAEDPSFLARLNPLRLIRRSAARQLLRRIGLSDDDATGRAFAAAACFELNKRAAAADLRSVLKAFELNMELDLATLSKISSAARAFAGVLDEMEMLARRLDECPARAEAWTAAGIGNRDSLNHFVERLRAGLAILETRLATSAALEVLAPSLEDEFLNARRREIETDAPSRVDFAALERELPRLIPYQIFRIRIRQLSQAGQSAFAGLRYLANALRATERQRVPEILEAILRCEAARYWKQEIEEAHPELMKSRQEIEQQVAELTTAHEEIRVANAWMLGRIEASGLGNLQAWSRIWPITGANSLRLRQFLERAHPLGLLKVRPVWLVNPDVVSRVFPLEPGFFDVVVFDEASQMRVENALPAFFRAKRAVISGDSKQLPPSNFFSTRIESEEDEEDDDWLDAAELEDAEAEAAEMRSRKTSADRRHVKDCADVLALAEGVLPIASLDIHYRSAYRELIAFSNAAYYDNRLHVPVRRPRDEVARFKPIEVRRVDGTYRLQTNPEESLTIVAILDQLWRKEGTPPTVGVVTFNLKQAELITAHLDRYAAANSSFRAAYERELGRTAYGENVGFFIRNLESVQGDERDWIIFSTTFGRDSAGLFRRSFGVLGQSGGERRLNVAVTRAKEKVIIVTSMPTDKISTFLGGRRPPHLARDYLQAYLRYAENIDAGNFDSAAALLRGFAVEPAPPPPPREASVMVSQAFETLQSAGFHAELMPTVDDAFKVDIAVRHNGTGLYALGVEFDTPRHPLLASARAREVWRPKLLTRGGLRVHRIYSGAWLQDTDAEKHRLVNVATKAVTGGMP